MSKMQIPTTEQCYQLMYEMKMLDHIVEHSMQVCRVALFLTNQLTKELEIHLDYDLIQAAALLHDITKTRSFDTGEDHALSGGQFLFERGYPEIGHLVRQHVRLDHYSTNGNPGEAEIINYADKRVLHDKVVLLDKRLNYILERYGKEPELHERIQWLWGKTIEMESAIFKLLPFSPEDLTNFLTNQGDNSISFLEYKNFCQQL